MSPSAKNTVMPFFLSSSKTAWFSSDKLKYISIMLSLRKCRNTACVSCLFQITWNLDLKITKNSIRQMTQFFFFLMDQDLKLVIYTKKWCQWLITRERLSTWLVIREMKIKATVRYYFTLIGKANSRRQIITSFGENVENWTIIHCWWECKTVLPFWKLVWKFCKISTWSYHMVP